ncbi:MAG: prolyl oligopeptidase family serine peptidase [Bacteroidetes bacterium]|nr:prolyl oligopeptidase family serine peptidase [Bacteroidota bacterium]
MLKYLVYQFIFVATIIGQQLTIESIMRDPKWFGYSPNTAFWSEESDKIYFIWRRSDDIADSLYSSDLNGSNIKKVHLNKILSIPSQSGTYNNNFTLKVYEKFGDIFLLDCKKNVITRITNTSERESDPFFSFNEKQITYSQKGNIFLWDISSGITTQLTNLQSGAAPKENSATTKLQQYLLKQQIELMQITRERKEKSTKSKEIQKIINKFPKPFYHGTKNLNSYSVSANGNFVALVFSIRSDEAKATIVPSYVTESGFTENLPARTKVGEPQTNSEFYIYDVQNDSMMLVNTNEIVKNNRQTFIVSPSWSTSNTSAFVQIFSIDNKDRWIVSIDPQKGKLGTILSHQNDSAWVGGVGAFNAGWMPDNKKVWFQSEESGFGHLYVINFDGTNKKQLTSGGFEVYNPQISRKKDKWYFHSNEVHPGERHFYTMPVDGGTKTKLTNKIGIHDCIISPDENYFTDIYSFTNKPNELFIQKNSASSEPHQITKSRTEEFLNRTWIEPEVITFTSRDSFNVFARLYQPKKEIKNNAAVIFVHGAGYLQNAHKGWSGYFREYFFHNLLVEQGYTVLDVDYRASAGYGKYWRTAIYRFMGGKDLDDNVDGANLLIEKYGIDPKRIGIYGGSYGGFITFMAMFTTPNVFAAGAALRPVTDWAHYNHGYTSDILNIPQDDSVAYRRSSPIYHAEGLKGALLICHGMVDVNVHYQDAVRLVQRLIELKKENWEFASYPVEDHGFQEETSWMDEYKRILKLFNTNLLKK